MTRLSVPTADAILNTSFSVLDKGFVRFVDYLGGDARIVQAARVSYGDGTKTVREDAALIDYLMRHSHTSPFEQVILTFHIKMPIFVARQWIRHRTARLNEISGRYSILAEEFYLPEQKELKGQAKKNKQGRANASLDETVQANIAHSLQAQQADNYSQYSDFLEQGLARELARINLPLSLYTEMYWQIDLHNLFHFLKLRLDSHAQYEIRAYAEVLADIAKAVAPMAYNSFEEHSLNAHNISATELELIRQAIDSDKLQELLEQSDLRKSRKTDLRTALKLAEK